MKRILKEYGDKQTTRDKMAKAAKRSLERDGDDSTYHNAMNSLNRRGSSREEMQDFQNNFEKNENRNMKKQVKLSEADLHQVIKGAVESLLKEYTDFDKMKMYGEPTQDEDDFNEQPVNDIANESKEQFKVTESQLKDIIKESVIRILNETDWRTIHSAMDKAGEQSIDPNLPSGLKQRRNQQWQRFKDGLNDRMRSQYGGLDKEQVRDAKAGKGASYNTADRRQLRNMDKLNADYSKFMSANSKNPADELYKDGKWQ